MRVAHEQPRGAPGPKALPRRGLPSQRKPDIEAHEIEQGSKNLADLRLWPKDKPQRTAAQIRGMSAKNPAGQGSGAGCVAARWLAR